ncbi:MAG TPA: hypothetical protein PKM32_08825, partial [Planctomycetota bacterium]|nr:hypothetical protein [Planctomycetota bacterium]
MSPEATVKAEIAPVETPKTFDLDAILGTPPPSTTPAPINENSPETGTQITPTPTETPTIPNVIPMPEATTIPVPSPAFT